MARYIAYNANQNNSIQNLQTEVNILFKNMFLTQNTRKADLVEFLGLKDKNGTIIHFGDILKDNENVLLTPVCEIEHGEHIFFFKPVHFLNKEFKIGCKSTYSNTLEIVGNIYDKSNFSRIKIKLSTNI